jgi:Glycosyl hydrolase family 95 catalytic domain/Domain of unknown function (DUF5703)
MKIYCWIGCMILLPALNHARGALLNVNYSALVSRADLDYSEPASRSEEGMPVGNGRMGSLVWTTPSALKFQINRVDVFAEDSTTVSFPQADSDYAAGCGYVDINLVEAGGDVFTGKDFHQHLSLYDALMTAQGKGVTARVLAWPQRDVMAVEIDDERPQPEPISVDLRMLRYAIQRVTGRNYELATNHAVLVQTAEHTALSKLDIRDGRILLIQQFRENDFYDSSAVAIRIIGRKSRARYLNDSTVQLCAAPGKGRFTILISSAASFDPQQDTGALAEDALKAAEPKGFAGLQSETAEWWHDFWSKGFVYMHSASGQADFVEANYTYFIYLMGASSRGNYPPRFGGMLWRTTGDLSRWGSQYWWANTSAYYNDLLPANRPELLDPLFSLYSGMFDACALAAKQQWGSQGIWIPETTFFNGPEKLPDDIAAELQDLMLVRKPYAERSAKFQWFAEVKNRHNSRWNFLADGYWDHGHYVVPTKGGSRNANDGGERSDIFGHTTHILGVGARIANLYWLRYEYTMDTNWLRDRAYPMIKGAAEFYRNFPNFQKGADGVYHLHHVNNGESQWNSTDPAYEVTCMRMIFPLAIRASEILGVDDDLRPLWQEINDHLPPMPERRYPGGGVWGSVSTNPPPAESRGTNDSADESLQAGPVTATNAVPGERPRRFRRNGAYGAFVYGGPGGIEPIGPQPEFKRRFLGFDRLASFIDERGIGGAQIFRNRLRLREGPGAIDAEHLGGLAAGIHTTMLSSDPDTPGGEPVLKIINNWPNDWDAAFTLRACGAFIVSSAQQDGKIPFVEIQSLAGGGCRLANPWNDAKVTLYRDGKPAETLSGETLTLVTKKGETLVAAPEGSPPSPVNVP